MKFRLNLHIANERSQC